MIHSNLLKKFLLSILLNIVLLNSLNASYIQDSTNNIFTQRVKLSGSFDRKHRAQSLSFNVGFINLNVAFDKRINKNVSWGVDAGFQYMVFNTNYYSRYDNVYNNDHIKKPNIGFIFSSKPSYIYNHLYLGAYIRYNLSSYTNYTFASMPYSNTGTYLELNGKFGSLDLVKNEDNFEMAHTYRIGLLVGRQNELDEEGRWIVNYGVGCFQLINSQFNYSELKWDVRVRIGRLLYKTNY